MGGQIVFTQLPERKALACVVVAGAGVATHLLYFIRGEHDRQAYQWVKRAGYGVVIFALGLLCMTGLDVPQALVFTSLFAPSYFVGLYASIAIYRLFLHPLRGFPGPFWARLSNFYHSYAIKKSDNYLYIQKLHKKYGPIVRTGKLS